MAQTLRYRIDEVLTGMLASSANNDFTDNIQKLDAAFKAISKTDPLLAPLAPVASTIGSDVVLKESLQTLVDKGLLKHESGHYSLSPQAKLACKSIKKMVFGDSDIKQLEAAARDFDILLNT
jgi:hypothetical protein